MEINSKNKKGEKKMNEQKQEQNLSQMENAQNQSGDGVSPLMNQTNAQNGKQPKKNGKIIVAIAVAVLVVIVAGVSTVALNASVRNRLFLSVLSPKQYYLKTEANNIENLAEQIGDSYGKKITYAMQQAKKPINGTANIKLSVDDSYTSMLGLNGIFPIELNTNTAVDLKNDAEQVEAELKFAEEAFIGTKVMINTGKKNYGDTYVQIPQLSSAYIYTPLAELAQGQKEEENYINSLKKVYANYLDKPTSSKLVSKLISRYGKTVFEGLDNVKLEKNVKYTVSNKTKKVTKIIVTINEKNAEQAMEKAIETASKDKDLKNELIRLEACTSKEYDKGIKELKKWIADQKKDTSDEQKMIMNVWVDSNGTILGRDFTVKEASDSSGFYYHTIKNGKTDYFEAGSTQTDTFVITGNSTKEKNGYKGDIALAQKKDGNNAVKLSFEGVGLVDEQYGSCNGTFTLTGSGDDMAVLQNSSLKLTLKGGKNEQKFAMEAVFSGQSIGKLEYEQFMKEGKSLSYPPKGDIYKTTDSDEMEKYAETVDMNAIQDMQDKINEISTSIGSILGLDSSMFGSLLGNDDESDISLFNSDDNAYDYGLDEDI